MAKMKKLKRPVSRSGAHGTYTATQKGAVNKATGQEERWWEITGGHTKGPWATFVDADFQSHGIAVLEQLAQEGRYDAPVEFMGKSMDPAQIREARVELFETGANATLRVGDWTRVLGVDEIRQGGEFDTAVHLFAPEQWPAFVREMFARLYGLDRELVDDESRAPGTDWMLQIFQKAQEQANWGQLCEMSAGDPWACGLSASAVVKKFEGEIRKLLNELPPEDPERLQQEAQSIAELAPGSEQAEQAQKKADDAVEQAQQVAEKLEQSGEQLGSMIAEAAAEAAEEIDGMQQAMGAFGAGPASGGLNALASPTELREALRNNEQLRRIATMLGRMRVHARNKQRTKVKYVPEQIVDVTVGGELERLLPSELMQFAHPVLRTVAKRKLLERQSLQYEMEGTESADLGPMIMAVDCSGSMFCAHGSEGSRLEWAIAVGICLCEIAMNENRPFVFYHFDSRSHDPIYVRKPKELTLDTVMEMLSSGSGWGTDISRAVDRAAEIQREGEWNKADLVLISDGDDTGYDDALERFKNQGAAAYAISIGYGFPEDAKKALSGYAELTSGDVGDNGKIDLVFGI